MRTHDTNTPSRNKRQATKKWESHMEIVDGPVRVIDLSSNANDDGWDDCLDDEDEVDRPSAIERVRQIVRRNMQATAARSKGKGNKKPRGPRSRVTTGCILKRACEGIRS